MRLLVFFGACIALAASTASAELTWRGLTIAYDGATWRPGPPDNTGALVLFCIAPDCERSPAVFATATPIASGNAAQRLCTAVVNDGAGWRRTVPVIDLSGTQRSIPFAVVRRWSGCRAMDPPIIEACGEHNGTLYRFTNWLGGGCNRAAEMPEDHFLALIRSVRAAP